MSGFAEFSLEFHLAHLILREADTNSGWTAGSQNTVADLSFLWSLSPSGSSPKYEMYQAHISVVICGWSNTQWTGYAFANTGLENKPFQEQEEDEPIPDLFAADRDDDFVKDANMPTWDARVYWLQIVATRCQLVLKEWRYLVYTIEEGIETWVRKVSDRVT
jgi:hypothetical protein